MTQFVERLKDKICNDGQFCDDVGMLALSGVVFWMMALSIGQMTV